MLSRSLAPLALAFCAASVSAQTAPFAGHWEPIAVDSGVRANHSSAPSTVFHELIALPPGTPWMRVHFAGAALPPGSAVRVTSLLDGEAQTLNAEHLAQWQHGSAFLNGDRVSVELVAAPGTPKNSFRIEKVWAGDVPGTSAQPETICGATDDRQPSSNPAVGRLLSSGFAGACTAFLIDAPGGGSDRGHLSAGHCFGNSQVLQFNVPASSANCALVHPPVASQFAVDFANFLSATNGAGDDYAVFKCFRNPTSNLTTFQTQGTVIPMATALPANGSAISEIGFGVDGSDANGAGGGNASCACQPASGAGARNQTQQSEPGTLLGTSGTAVLHQLDACAGSSGAPLIETASGRAIGIQTHGGCANPAGGTSNVGTAITAPNLVAAIQVILGGTGITNNECATASQIDNGNNPLLSNAGATLSNEPWTCGTGITADVWHVYRARCTGTVTIDSCGAGTAFDTVLQLFSGTCGALTVLDCNDDTCGTRSTVTAQVTLGTNYYVRVGGAGGANGNYDLNVVCNGTTQVPNDECSGAIQVFGGANAGFTNASATTSFAWPCAAGGTDVWFRYVATCTGLLNIDTCSTGTDYDSALEAFSGPCTSLVSLACNDDSCGLQSVVTISVTQGTTYYFRVGGYNSSTGNFDLNLVCVPGGNTNDECAASIAVVAGPNGPFNTTTATTSLPAWPCAGGGNDLWYHYDVGCVGTVVFDTCAAASFDTALQVFSGTCGALVSVGCNDDSCGLSSTLSFTASRGRYYVRVGGYSSARGSFVLTVTPPTGNGAFQTIPNGCGPTTLTASGAPNLGTTVGFTLGGTSGTPLLWLGAPSSIPLCPPATCTLGATFQVIVASGSVQVAIPCLPALVGGRVAIQGADIGGPGGCAAGTVAPVPLNLSPTVVATIG